MAACPKEDDTSIVRLWLELKPCLDMRAPEFAFVLRTFREIDDIVNGQPAGNVFGEERAEPFESPGRAPFKIVAGCLAPERIW